MMLKTLAITGINNCVWIVIISQYCCFTVFLIDFMQPWVAFFQTHKKTYWLAVYTVTHVTNMGQNIKLALAIYYQVTDEDEFDLKYENIISLILSCLNYMWLVILLIFWPYQSVNNHLLNHIWTRLMISIVCMTRMSITEQICNLRS